MAPLLLLALALGLADGGAAEAGGRRDAGPGRMKGATDEAFLDDVRRVVGDLFPEPGADAGVLALASPDAGRRADGGEAATPVQVISRRDPKSGVELIFHPAGSYLMGCSEGD